MSDNVLAVGLFWRNDLGCASVVPSEQTSSSYIILYVIIDDLQNYCLGACNGANRRCQVRCQAGRAHTKDWARPYRAYKFRPPKVDDFEQPPKRCCSSDFHNKHIVGKSLFRTKWKCFGFENETRNGEMAGVQSWPKYWLSGSCPRAQC